MDASCLGTELHNVFPLGAEMASGLGWEWDEVTRSTGQVISFGIPSPAPGDNEAPESGSG